MKERDWMKGMMRAVYGWRSRGERIVGKGRSEGRECRRQCNAMQLGGMEWDGRDR